MKNKNMLQIIFGIIMIMLSISGVGVYIGILLDKLFNSSPIFLVIFTLIFVSLSLYFVYIYHLKNL